jgi:hypothetical protein
MSLNLSPQLMTMMSIYQVFRTKLSKAVVGAFKLQDLWLERCTGIAVPQVRFQGLQL